jgi:uroporphyrin-3 C-methyltransferase
VRAAKAWLDKYFDMRLKPVQALSAMLGEMAAIPMASDVPDISASLEAVRTLKPVRERPPDKSARPAPAVPAAAK